MSEQVSQQEIIEALSEYGDSQHDYIAERIKAHGIASPDGWMLVPIEDLTNIKDTLEYWINKGSKQGMSEFEYNSWLALGHHSLAMKQLKKAMLSAVKEKE